ncbi:MAG: SURF1 family protein [Brachymonas sp.]
MNAPLQSHTRFGRSQWLILIAAIACISTTASLGAWQMRRATHKERLAAAISKQNEQLPGTNTALNAIDLGVFKPEEWLHRRMQLQGRWLHEHTVFLDNRPMQVSGSQRVGFYVATPLAVEGKGDGERRVIWVQRGWVQRDFQDRSRLPQLPQASASVIVQGRLIAQVSRAYAMNEPASSTATPADPRASRIWQNLPTVNFSSQVLMPVALLQTAPESAEDGLQRNWPAADTGVAKHHGYAFQWFALSALIFILYVWFQLIAPRRKLAA